MEMSLFMILDKLLIRMLITERRIMEKFSSNVRGLFRIGISYEGT